MMNLQSDSQVECRAAPLFSAVTPGTVSDSPFLKKQSDIVPFEFRSLTAKDVSASCTDGRMRKDHEISVGSVSVGVGPGWHGENNAATADAIKRAHQDGIGEGEIRGRSEARAEFEKELNRSIDTERQRIKDEISQFNVARDLYFAEVEHEVVKLALAIAGRVLHREATIDPLMLNGVVRVAMERMADRSGVVLRVAAGDAETWNKLFESMDQHERPIVTEDTQLTRGECVLNTRMGKVELGFGVQLEEIEKGFVDLLNHRPVQ